MDRGKAIIGHAGYIGYEPEAQILVLGIAMFDAGCASYIILVRTVRETKTHNIGSCTMLT